MGRPGGAADRDAGEADLTRLAHRTSRLGVESTGHEQRHRLHQHQSRPLRRRAEGVPRDSQHQRPSRSTRADVKRAAEWSADEMRRIGMQNVRLIDTPGFPVVYGDWLGRRRGADDSLLRPLRRAAGRSRRPVGVAAVRGHRARRRDLRARLGRRQGAGLHALQGHRGAPEAERPAAGEHQGHPRRGRGGRVGESRQLREEPQGRARRPTSSSSPTRRCSTAASRRSATACAASSTSRSICAARSPTCTPARSAARSPIPTWCSRRSWRR